VPFIRYTYGPDIARYGDGPIQVEDVEVRVLTEMRRAVEVAPDELAELPKADLQQMADDAGVEVPARAPRKQIVEKLTQPEG
jgi:hypothetical protein